MVIPDKERSTNKKLPLNLFTVFLNTHNEIKSNPYLTTVLCREIQNYMCHMDHFYHSNPSHDLKKEKSLTETIKLPVAKVKFIVRKRHLM